MICGVDNREAENRKAQLPQRVDILVALGLSPMRPSDAAQNADDKRRGHKTR